MNEYTRQMAGLIAQVPKELIGSLEPSDKKIRIPTQAFSEFLINRELGDWAEDIVKNAINATGLELTAVRYGRSENLVAGEPGFKEFFEDYVTELRGYGKRPDLLVYDQNPPSEAEITGQSAEQLKSTAQRAIAAIEVRSSLQSLAGTRIAGDLSFTPKIEDIANVFRWIQNHGVRHFYVQVIFGAVFAISFERILELLVIGPKEGGFTIDKEPRNQFKSTIYIPLSLGTCLSTRFVDPDLKAFKKQLPTGRMLFGVSFSAGQAVFTPSALKKLLAT